MVRCFGQGGERLALAGVGERNVQVVPVGGWEGAGTDAGLQRSLLLINSWQRIKSRFVPRDRGSRTIVVSFWKNGEPEISSCTTAS